MKFEETQGMTRFWWVLIPVPLAFFLIIKLGAIPIQQREFVLISIVIGAVELIIACFFLLLKMQTSIDADGVSFRYKPLVGWRHFKWEDIERAWVRPYKPFKEFGGWGYKTNITRKTRAYNVWGNKGLQVYLANGRKLLFGTQKAQELVDFLKQLKEKHNIAAIEKDQLDG